VDAPPPRGAFLVKPLEPEGSSFGCITGNIDTAMRIRGTVGGDGSRGAPGGSAPEGGDGFVEVRPELHGRREPHVPRHPWGGGRGGVGGAVFLSQTGLAGVATGGINIGMNAPDPT